MTGGLLVVLGAPLLFGGMTLLRLSGSAYYLLAGVALIVAGVLIALRRPMGLLIFALTFAETIVWALAEVGLDYWQPHATGGVACPDSDHRAARDADSPMPPLWPSRSY